MTFTIKPSSASLPALAVLLAGCTIEFAVGEFHASLVTVAVTPHEASVQAGQSLAFAAQVTGSEDPAVGWTVEGGCGSVSDDGVYTAPQAPGVCLVIATSHADPLASDTAAVTVTPTRFLTAGYECFQTAAYPPPRVDFSALTHLSVRSWVSQAGGQITLGPSTTRELALDLGTRAHAAGRKVLLSIGGFVDPHFPTAAAPAERDAFVASALGALDDLGYDGFELNQGGASDDDFIALAQQLRAARPGLVMTAPVSWLPSTAAPAALLAPSVDQVLIQTSEMALANAGWVSWHYSPLDGYGTDHAASVVNSVSAFVAAGVAKEKLGLWVDFGGQAWTAPVTGPLQAIGAGRIAYTLDYPDVMRDFWGAPGVVRGFSDESTGAGAHAKVAWLSFPGGYTPAGYGNGAVTWLSYEDERSIAAKGAWARSNGLGGGMVDRLAEGVTDSVTGANPLLDAMKTAFLE